MYDILDHLTDILIGLAILFLVPLIYIGLKQDTLIRTVVAEQSEELLEDTQSKGYLSREMFDEFQQSLSRTGMLYDIKFEHKQKILEPEYRFRTLDEVLEEQNKAYTGTNTYHSYPVSTNIPVVTDPIDNNGLTMNTETNESVLTKASGTPSTGHVHSDACYQEHTHTAACQLVGSNHTSKEVYAFKYDRGADGIYAAVQFKCYSCYETFYSIYYQYNYWKSGGFQIGCSYKRPKQNGEIGLANVSYYYNYSLTDPRVSTLMSQIDTIVNRYAPYQGRVVIDVPAGDLLYVDGAQNYAMSPYTGCPTCGEILGPAVSYTVDYSSSDYMFGSKSYYQTMRHAGTNHILGELTRRETGGGIGYWAYDSISFSQSYLRKDGSIMSKSGKWVGQYLSVPGSQPRPGPEWTKVETEVSFNGNPSKIDEWRKPNPEWGIALMKYSQADFAWFGYDPKYSCPECLSKGTIASNREFTYTCGLKETHRHNDSCYYTIPPYYGTVHLQRYDSGWNTYYSYGVYIYSPDQMYFLSIVKGMYSAYERFIRITAKVNGIDVYNTTLYDTSPLYAAWNTTFTEYWNHLNSAYGTAKPNEYTYNYSIYGGALPAPKFLTCYKPEYTVLSCDKKIDSISPTHPVQSVYTNEPLITTVTATYQDGSTKVVLATSSYTTATPGTNRMVTLVYTDTLGITRTTDITFHVIPRNKSCAHGHVYKLNNDGSDPGCPFCRQWLASLTVNFPTTPNFTIYRGTTLSDNGVTLLATYLDGHTELVETEYIDNLDKYYVGSQYVTLSYKGHYAYLTVVTKRNLKLCPVCHRHYELHPDDSEPGCPYCARRTPIFTGNVMQYYNKRYTDEILEALYEGAGIYRFSDLDFFTISVKSKSGSIGTRLLSAVYLNNEVNTIHVIESGYVREDGQR